MITKKILLVAAMLAAVATVPALARGNGNGGGGRGAGGGGGTCPYGFVPGTGQCGGQGAGTCDGSQQRLRDGSCATADQAAAPATRGNPNSTGTPLRDGSGKTTAPGKGAKDGTGNNPRHATNVPQS